jgi:hypothetical protein
MVGCVVAAYLLLFLVVTETRAANSTLGDPDQSCLDADSMDLERDCPVRTALLGP